MNSLLQSNPNLWQRGYRVLSAQLFSTSSSSAPTDTPYRRISGAGDPGLSMVPILEQWLEEGNDVKQTELQKLVKQLRQHRRFTHALQISQWMSDRKRYDLSPGDVAVRLDLISKVHGLEEAEKYFNNIPDASRGYQVYGALLNCYTHTKHLEKAEAVMQKMKELDFIKTPLPYNSMLSLYSQLGKFEKLDILMQEMQEKGISCDLYTFNIRLNAYVVSSDIEGMEKLLMKMEVDPQISMDFHAYVVAANGYLKAGTIEKALMMLKRSEKLIHFKSKRVAYETLLTLYAAARNKAEVYRIWDIYKKNGRFFNVGYLCMINSLLKLDDIGGAEKIWEEWDAGKTAFDIRIPNSMIKAYSRQGLLEKAEGVINKIIESGMEPDVASWDHLATGYHAGGQISKAVEAIKKAILASKLNLKPSLNNLEACLEYLKGQGEVEAAEELLKMTKENCRFSPGARDRLSSCMAMKT